MDQSEIQSAPQTIELSIYRGLLNDGEYASRVLPYLEEKYFTESHDKVLYNLIEGHYEKYNRPPNRETLLVALDKAENITELEHEYLLNAVDDICNRSNFEKNTDWLINETESFCQDQAMSKAILDSLDILQGKDAEKGKGAIVEYVESALSVSFDSSVGHDYFGDARSRFETYVAIESRIPFTLKGLNEITRGGLPPKTLSLFIAGTNVGKSLILCSCSADWLMMGKNVLYISNEMSEAMVSERIDSNLMNVDTDKIIDLGMEGYLKKIEELRKKTVGQLHIHEYPTGTAHAGHFQELLNNLKRKKGFVPDVICLDYLNNCTSMKYKSSTSANSYTIMKAVSEEVRALAQRNNIPVVSATQFNREGAESSDPTMGNVSESFGVMQTVDLVVGVMSNDELLAMGQFMWVELKNRMGRKTGKKWMTGVNYDRQKVFDIDGGEVASKLEEVQENLQKMAEHTSPVKSKPATMAKEWNWD